MPKKVKHGYLKPEVINPPTRRCVTIYVPDDRFWWAAFWGQMSDLMNNWLWEGDRATQEQIVSVWKDVYASARQSWLDGECTLPLEFRVVSGIVEYRPDPSAAWTAIGEACPCEPVTPSPQYNQNTGTFDQRACNIAVGLVDWIMEKFNDAIDQIEADADIIVSFDAIFAAMMPVYLGADALLDAINEVVEAGVNAARAFDTETHRDEMKRFLYCEMYSTGEMTSQVWTDFLSWAESEYNVGGIAIGWLCWDYWAKAFSVESIIARSRIVSYEESDCIEFSCGYDWEHVLDFEGEQDKLIFTDRGPYTSSIVAGGLQAGVYLNTAATPDFSTRRVDGFISIDYEDISSRIHTGIFYYTNGAKGNGNSVAPIPFVTLRLWTSGNTQVGSETSGNVGISLPDGTQQAELPGATAIGAGNKLYMAIAFTELSSNTGQPVTGSGILQKLVIRGNGKNPFVV